MAIDLSTVNSYPKFKTIKNVTTAATKIILPKDATRVAVGSPSALYLANEGDEGSSFGDGGVEDFTFIPANNVLDLEMEVGRQSNRVLLVGSMSGSATIHVTIVKN